MQGKIFALYKTKLGLKLMDKIARKFPRLLGFTGYLAIVIGFAGLVLMTYLLFKGAYGVIIGNAPILSPVLPGIKIATGLPELGFWHWIISIFIVAVVHEFFHGVFARKYDVKIKSSGFAFLGPILAAFVEPDEKKLEKSRKREQLAIFAAGPFANIVLGIIFLLITGLVLGPAANATLDYNGVSVAGFETDSVLEKSGMQIGEVIKEINDVKIDSKENLAKVSSELKPGDNVKIITDKGTYNVNVAEHPNFKGKGYLGIAINPAGFKEEYQVRYGEFLLRALFWLYLLFWWIYVISLGIGIFNLVPLGPVDGGRMLLTGLTKFFNIKTSKKIWNFISILVLVLIFINLSPWIIKLLLFVSGLFMG